MFKQDSTLSSYLFGFVKLTMNANLDNCLNKNNNIFKRRV